MNETMADLKPPLMTTVELSAYLRVPVSTIYKWRTTGTEPTGAAYRVGRYLRWNAGAIDAWLEAGAMKGLNSNG